MNFDEFKNQYYNGDDEAALRELTYEGNTHDFKITKNFEDYKNIMATLTPIQTVKYLKYMKEEIKVRPQYTQEIIDNARKETTLEISDEEFHNLKKNPYKAKMLKAFLGLVISGAFIVYGGFLAANGNTDFSVLSQYILPGVEVYFALDFGINIFKYFGYKKMQKFSKENQSNVDSENNIIEEGKKNEF